MSESSVLDSMPQHAIVFEVPSEFSFPKTSEQVSAALKKLNGPTQTIEYNPEPSGFGIRCKKQIDTNYLLHGSLENLAEKIGTNPTTFGRVFRKDFGLTPVRYRNHLRVLAGSTELLKGTKVTKVSELAGFQDLSRFNKQFKSLSGVSPKKFSPVKKDRKTPSFIS